MEPKIEYFLDERGRINQLPSKQKKLLAVLAYLTTKFELDTDYTEHQVNGICDRWHTFNDFYLLRRELVDNGFLGRERDGSRYWRIYIPE